MYRHGSFLLFAGLLASTNCSCGPGDDDIDGGSRDTGVAVADATGPDAFVADANLSDAGADGSADATVDGGVCITERLPLPAEPVCTLEEATCYRECPDRACTSACGVIFLSDCGQCIASVMWNCMIDHCAVVHAEWDCCIQTLCPPVGECVECDEERAAMRACSDEIYDGYCRAELEVCFP